MTRTMRTALCVALAIVSLALLMVSGMDDYGDRMNQLDPSTAVVASE